MWSSLGSIVDFYKACTLLEWRWSEGCVSFRLRIWHLCISASTSGGKRGRSITTFSLAVSLSLLCSLLREMIVKWCLYLASFYRSGKMSPLSRRHLILCLTGYPGPGLYSSQILSIVPWFAFLVLINFILELAVSLLPISRWALIPGICSPKMHFLSQELGVSEILDK